MTKSEYNRLSVIDTFRGLAIILMVLANYLGGVLWIPAWLKHSSDVGLTNTDLVAPLFIFAIGLTYGLSFYKRLRRDGPGKTYQHFFTRWMAVIGIGAVISAGAITVTDLKNEYWGVLQAIGIAGLVTLPFLRLTTFWRATIGLGLLGIYQILLNRYWLQMVLDSPHGGLPGSLSWGAMLLLATALSDLYFNFQGRIKHFFLATILTLTSGIGLSFLTPVSKNRVSASYVLISLGVSALVFLLFHWLENRFRLHSRLLIAWGKNPMLLYLLHYLLLGVFFLPDIPAWYSQAHWSLVLLQLAFMTGVLSWIAMALGRRNFILSL